MRVFGGKGIRRIYEVKNVLEARSGRRFTIQYNIQYLFAIYDIYTWKKKIKKIDDRK